jgi:hypothetical protein
MARSNSRSRSPVYERSRSPPIYERTYERTRSPIYEKKYGGGDALRSPTRGDLRTTAATKKYGAEFDDEYQPVSSFKSSPGYASRFQT